MHNKPHTKEAKAKLRAARAGKPAPWKQRPTVEIDGATHYRCGSCSSFLPREHFYTSKRTSLGIKSECKRCHIMTCVASRDKDRAREANRRHMELARRREPERFHKRDAEASAQRKVTPKVVARRLLNAAVRSGRIQKPTACSKCLEERRLHGHHDDYSQPLRVEWLCPLCHAAKHRAIATAVSVSHQPEASA